MCAIGALQTVILHSHHPQILRGPPGVKPSEPLVDFIHSFHDAFKGGIFWINGKTQEFVEASDEVCKTNLN